MSVTSLPLAGAARQPRSRRSGSRRWATRALLLVALLSALAGWAWLERSLATEARVEEIAGTGIPPTPDGWTRIRAWLQGPPTVALQIGHLHAHEHPDELADLRTSTGGRGGGVNEVDVNRAVAIALAERLAAAGVQVELLAATVPPGYGPSVLVSLHADASGDPARRGYKSAHREPARNRREPWLRRLVDVAYLRAAPMPDDGDNVSGAMLDYYAFAHDRVRHAARAGTAGLIVEMGYLSHPLDRAWLGDPNRPAGAIAEGVLAYLVAIDRWHPELATSDPAREPGVVGSVRCVQSFSFCP
ncbi:MAG: N-acetylmuramoyl-L-alanine amidase [Trueperaceae bacterium]|nr:N-acetylmuramoyl-L-alanine amidase [Trueperaceae bacterium]